MIGAIPLWTSCKMTDNSCNDSWKGDDKWMHFFACFVIALICPILSIIIAFGKEAYDSHASNNHWCWKDISYDMIGMLLGTCVHAIVIASLL